MHDIRVGRVPGMTMNIRSRAAGGLLGLALGDALGLCVDFGSRAERQADPVTGLREASGWGKGLGIWSDETSLALCLADSICATGFDPQDFGQRALSWLDEGHRSAIGRSFGAGGQVVRALERIRGGMPAVIAGGRGENDNGNGGLSRMLPASIWLAGMSEPLLWRAVASYSAPTHGHPRSFLASWLHALVVTGLMAGLSPTEAYGEAMERAQVWLATGEPRLRAEAGHFDRVLGGNLAKLPSTAVRGSGYVVHCLEASLWCLLGTGDFHDCVLAAVNLGENANATAATAGGLAGLAYGREALPEKWVSRLSHAQDVEASGLALAGLVETRILLPGVYRVLPGRLFAGPWPHGAEDGSSNMRLSALLDAGIDAVLDLTEAGEGFGAKVLPHYWAEFKAMAAGYGIEPERRRVPIADMSAAGGPEIRAALADIDAMLGSGRRVYVHCLGGLGRTGTVIGAWLVEHGLAAPGEALDLLAALREASGAGEHGSPETQEQRLAVSRWRSGAAALTI